MDEASRYAQVKALYLQLSELPQPQRQIRLAQLRTELDAEVVWRLQRMLDAEPAATKQIDAPVLGMLAELAGAESLEPGARLGAWTLIRKIGEGGMGSVYLAQRSDGHFEQTAAVKVLRGVPSPTALQYLTRERQILATLAHPNIARLFDGGATPHGQPFLVMEYLEGGLPIDQYCERQQLMLSAILQLLIEVCAAVSFAHSRLIVHCDLKPGNILVDAQGRPMLLDFGIARLLVEDSEGARSQPLGAQVRAFTPGYASPEQERGDPVSTLADVYSLGYLLAALLRAHPPRAELQAIAACATKADPAQRYASVAALSRDLARFLAGEAVHAMQSSWRYRTTKLLRRHWAAVAVATGFLITVGGFTLQLMADRDRALAAERNAISERDRATQAELSARQISQFLGNILSSVDPDNAKSMDRTLMRSLLDEAALKARTELRSNPLVLRQVESVVADSYRAISDFAAAVQHYDAALLTFESPVASKASTVEGLQRMELGYRKIVALIDGGEATAAGPLLDALIEQAEQYPGPAAELSLKLKSRKAQQLFRVGELRTALDYARATQRAFEGSAAVSADAWLFQLNILGLLESNHGEFDRAQTRMQQAIEIATRNYGAQHSTTLRARHSLAVLMLQAKRRPEARELLEPLLVDTERALGAGHLLTISTLSNLGTALRHGGNLQASATYYQQAHQRALQRFGAANPLTLDLANNLALYEIAAGQAEIALQRISDVLALSQQIHARLHPALVEALRTRARALSALGQTSEARAAWTEVLARDRDLYGADDAQTLSDQAELDQLSP